MAKTHHGQNPLIRRRNPPRHWALAGFVGCGIIMIASIWGAVPENMFRKADPEWMMLSIEGTVIVLFLVPYFLRHVPGLSIFADAFRRPANWNEIQRLAAALVCIMVCGMWIKQWTLADTIVGKQRFAKCVTAALEPFLLVPSLVFDFYQPDWRTVLTYRNYVAPVIEHVLWYVDVDALFSVGSTVSAVVMPTAVLGTMIAACIVR